MPKSTALERDEMWLKHSEKALFLFYPCHFPQKRRMGRNGKKH